MIDLEGKLRLHPAFRHEVVHVGAERTPILVIEDFLADAQVMVDYAAEQGGFRGGDRDAYYPGMRAPCPPIYTFAVQAFLGPVIGNAFGLPSNEVTGAKCDFSLVTTPPEKLQVLQRMPHIDNTNPKYFAILHYLCGPGHGGTSFYRHRQTGFENVTAERFPAYRAAVESQLKAGLPPARYTDGDDAMFERIATFDAAFNRVLVYRGLGLHSARIPPGFAFDADPRTGRLTANAFFYFR